MNKFLLATFICLLALFSVSCTSPIENRPTNSKPLVLASIGPDAFFLKTIGSDYIDVVTVVPPGASPHFFEPQPRQAIELKLASLWFRRGEMFENRLLKSLEKANPDLKTYDLREGLDLISSTCSHSHKDGHHHDHHHHDAKDLHTWVSPKMAIKNVQMMEKALVENFPEHADTFQKNASALIAKLSKYEKAIEDNLKKDSEISILVSHPAFAYFCRDYNIEQLSIETEGKEPHPRHIDNILKRLSNTNIAHIFIQMQYNNKGAIAIAEMTGIGYTDIDPYSEDYFHMITTLSEAISKKPLAET